MLLNHYITKFFVKYESSAELAKKSISLFVKGYIAMILYIEAKKKNDEILNKRNYYWFE